MACAGGIGAREDLPVERAARQLLKRQLEHMHMIGALPAAALPGRKIPLSTSRPQLTTSGLKPKPPGRPGTLLCPAPLRTGRAAFTASGSSKPWRFAGGQKCWPIAIPNDMLVVTVGV